MERSADSARTHAKELQQRRVLTQATLAAAVQLDLSQADLAQILGVSESSVTRMKAGSYQVDGKEFELAALLVRIYRSLNSLMGGHQGNMKSWFHAENVHLSGIPVTLVRTIEGVTSVARYLDFMRGAQ